MTLVDVRYCLESKHWISIFPFQVSSSKWFATDTSSTMVGSNDVPSAPFYSAESENSVLLIWKPVVDKRAPGIVQTTLNFFIWNFNFVFGFETLQLPTNYPEPGVIMRIDSSRSRVHSEHSIMNPPVVRRIPS